MHSTLRTAAVYATTHGLRIVQPLTQAVPVLLAELEATNQIKRFEESGRAFGVIRNFTKYQKPKTPNAIHPLPESMKLWRDNFGSVSETPPKQSGTTSEKPFQMEEGGGSLKEEEGKKVTAASQLTAVPSLGMPLDFKKLVFTSGLAYLVASGGDSGGDSGGFGVRKPKVKRG